MKYSTRMVYGIHPKELREMTSWDYFHVCKQGAIKRKMHLTHKSPNLSKWGKKRVALVNYIDKAITFCDEKIKEME